jgi:hypothetical protein
MFVSDRECPRNTANDQPIGHATGTPSRSESTDAPFPCPPSSLAIYIRLQARDYLSK